MILQSQPLHPLPSDCHSFLGRGISQVSVRMTWCYNHIWVTSADVAHNLQQFPCCVICWLNWTRETCCEDEGGKVNSLEQQAWLEVTLTCLGQLLAKARHFTSQNSAVFRPSGSRSGSCLMCSFALPCAGPRWSHP